MTLIVFPRQVLDATELTTVSTVAKHNIGEEATISTSLSVQPSVFKYVKASGLALTAYHPYVLTQAATIVTAAAPATSSVTKFVGIPQATIADGSYGWVCISGPCSASIYTAAVGDHLEVLNTGTYMVVDGSTGSTAESAGSVAICAAANALSAAATKAVVLIGKRVTVAAS